MRKTQYRLSSIAARSVLSTCLVLGAASCKSSFNTIFDDTEASGTGVSSVQILAKFPGSQNVAVNQGSTETFFVNATGRTGIILNYRWTLNGVQVQDGTSASYVFDAAARPASSLRLSVEVSDGTGRDSTEWQVKVNVAPQITLFTPNVTTARTSYDTPISFSVTAIDPNPEDATMTYRWLFDGRSGVLAGSGNSATLTPDFDMVGAHTVSVEVTDGSLSVTRSWATEVNVFYSACNTLAPNAVCTAVGMITVGNTLNPDTDASRFRIQPRSVFFDDQQNMLFGDNASHAVWYWNRTNAEVEMAGVRVAAKTARIVAGTGVGGFYGDSGLATVAQFNEPWDVYYDEINRNLFVADFNNNRIRRVAPSGIIATATTACTGPTSFAVYRTPAAIAVQNNLYLGCRSAHVVRSMDLNNLGAGANIVSGTNGTAATTAFGDGGVAASARYNLPVIVRADPKGNLYVLEEGGCRVRFINRSNYHYPSAPFSVTFYPTSGTPITIAPGNVGTILGATGSNACTNAVDGAFPVHASVGRIAGTARGMEIGDFDPTTGMAQLIFVSNMNLDTILVVNNSTTPGEVATFGSISVANNTVATIVGTGTQGYNGDDMAANISRLYDPQGLAFDPQTGNLMIADVNNYRIRAVTPSVGPITADDHKIFRVIGRGIGRAVGTNRVQDAAVVATEQVFNATSSVAFAADKRQIYFTDQSVHRIRMTDRFGMTSTVVGSGGGGSATTEQEYPSSVLMNQPRAVLLLGQALIYSDGTNHLIRVWNRGSTPLNIFGEYIPDGLVSSIAGNNGLSGYAGDGGQGRAVAARLNDPSGLATDGTNLFFTDGANHCVRKLSATGVLSTIAGTCGTPGALPPFPDNATATTLAMNTPRAITADQHGNLYVADTVNAVVRYINLNSAPSITIAGNPIAQGHMATVACGGALTGDGDVNSPTLPTQHACSEIWGVAARANQFCFTTRSQHNVRCVNITTGILTTVFGRPNSNSTSGAPLHYEQEGITGAAARMNFPRGITFDDENNLYVTDSGNSIVRRLNIGPPPAP